MQKIVLSFSLALGAMVAYSQGNPQDTIKNALQINRYMETYYIYDFANPYDHLRPDFLYSFNRHNEVNLNFALLDTCKPPMTMTR